MTVEQARANLAAARAALEEMRAKVAESEAELRQLSRILPPQDSRLKAARRAHAAKVRALQATTARERAALAALEEALGSTLLPEGAADVARLTAEFPIVLLPVRLETRFAVDAAGATSLKVRIYPDEFMADTHEPPLTEEEREAGMNFWRQGWAPENEKNAWRALVAQFPAPRAAWIAQTLTPSNLSVRPSGTPDFPATPGRAASWTRAAETRMLPDRWIVIGYRRGREVVRVVGLPIQEPLALSLNPAAHEETDTIPLGSDGLKLDEALAWTVDYERAVKAGMAVTIPPGGLDLARGLDRLVVVGVKSSLTAEDSGKRLGALLDAHHYTDGLAFLPQGTPTNNTGERPSGFPVEDPSGALSFAIERGASPLAAESNSALFARAFGVPEEIVAHLGDGDMREQPNAGAMNEALWPVTWGYFLDQMMDPVAGDTTLDLTRKHFTGWVRTRGPLPAFRTGSTPYGALPVSSLARWNAPTTDTLEQHLVPLLRSLQAIWLEQVPRVPRMGATNEPDADLLAVLGVDASTREARVRAVLGPEVQGQLFATLNLPTALWLSKQKLVIQQLMTRLGHPEWAPRIGNMSFADTAKLVACPFVAPAPLSETEPLKPFNYVRWIRTATLAELRQEQFPPDTTRPNALLYLLLRHSALSFYARLGTKLAISHNLATREDRLESEQVNTDSPIIAFGPRRPTGLQRLEQQMPTVTGTMTVGEFLSETPPGDHAAEISEFRAALERLENLPVAELDRLCTETLDACSHRLDAWITSLATKRLESLRQQNRTGSHLGAFGWVEDLHPDPAFGSANNGGFIHAPCAPHAATAAILRNAYLTRARQSGDRYAIDLSSARVRSALELLDAVRQGQPLGAVLGYRFERGLHEGHRPLRLDKYIDPFRKLFPLVAEKGEVSGEPVEAIAARNVVDGLPLRTAWQNGTIPWGQSGLPAAGNDRNAIESELRRLDDAVDAVADLLMSESVYQLVSGNSAKAGSVLDSIAQGLRPPEPEIAVQPRAGTPLTHRFAIVFDGQPPASWAGVPATPRAELDPNLDAWAGAMLGDPGNVRCRLSFLDSSSQRHTNIVSLVELGLRPLDLLALARRLEEKPADSELDARIALLAPADAAQLEIVFAADPAWDRSTLLTFPDVLEVARGLNALIEKCRPLEPKDLLPPEESEKALNTMSAEADQRSAAAVIAFTTAREKLEAASQTAPLDVATLRAALETAALFGVAKAFPRQNEAAEKLISQTELVLAEMDRRESAAKKAATTHDKLQAIFDRDFFFLPRFQCANPEELNLALEHGPALVGEAAVVTKWMQQASRTRPHLACWRHLSLLAGALGQPALPLRVAQLPHDPNARWVGLPFASEEDRPAPGRLSLVLHQTAPSDASRPWSGLLLDEWSELIPMPGEDTAIAFHYDDPGAEAPQTVLIAVPPTAAPKWDLDTLLSILNETFDLARIRAVDNDLLPLGQLLPAIYMASNPGKDTVSTNLHPVLVNVLSPQ